MIQALSATSPLQLVFRFWLRMIINAIWRSRVVVRAFLSIGFFICTSIATAAEDVSREYRIKAAYLYNLGKFITWPNEDGRLKDQPLTLCVYGHNPFDGYLDKLQERQIRGRTIAIREVAINTSVEGCQLLFISRLNVSFPQLLDAPPPYPPILTVSDDQDFLSRGGEVSLVTVNNNVQLDINLTRAKQAGFSINANLLEIAHRIQ